MNYDIYIDQLRQEIINEKLTTNRFDVIRKYQQELDTITNAKQNDMDITLKGFTALELVEKTLTKEDKKDKLNQLKIYLEGLEEHSRVYKEIIVEKKSATLSVIKEEKDKEYVNLQQRMTLQESNMMGKEIEYIKSEINKLENQINK
tara:strand:+ start:64 stop:504 length:441 start_codon:yes stop_codon:yes gene_type:complete